MYPLNSTHIKHNILYISPYVIR